FGSCGGLLLVGQVSQDLVRPRVERLLASCALSVTILLRSGCRLWPRPSTNRKERGCMRVSLLVTCLVDAFYPQVGQSTVRVLERLGVAVDFPERQTCCGQPAFNSGFHEEARAVAASLLDAFAASEYVVGPSGSCVAMVRHYLPKLFAGTAREAEARALAERTYELCELLVRKLGAVDVGARFPARVVYHASCHATRGLGLRE